MTDLIICEKPNVSKKIADALGKPKKKSNDRVPYYELERNGRKIIVASAVGHLYTLEEVKSDENKNKKKSFGRYPIFDIRWVPASTIKGKEYVQKYINTLNKLSKKANDYYIASDWDIEGELIGYHALRYCCNEDSAKRMRFSSLTKKDIIKAYEQPDNIDFGLVDAGDTRHRLDWYYGINMSVALMQCIRSVNRWHTMSTGRVQGPALSFLVDRELEIRKFVPKPYWTIDANLKDGLIAIHEKDKFWDEKEANTIYNKIKDEKEAIVIAVKKTKKTIKPNPPFDLGALQREAHRIFKFSPKKTQEIAQKLYEKAICSYPRTSSQKLPKDDNYIKDILNKVINHNIYGKYAKSIIEEGRKPIEGKKDDPAHPAIHFVDTPKEELPPEEQKLYDLIVRRTLAVFWDNAEREYSNISLDIKGEIFKLSGSRTIKEGWHEIYYFTKFDEKELPALRKNNKINVEKINIERKETKPPKRYTMSSIIKELENRELGTKCLTSDTLIKVKINNNKDNIKLKDISIEELFEILDNKYCNDKDEDDGVEFAINNENEIKCISYDENGNSIECGFESISRRKPRDNEKIYKIKFNDGSHIKTTEEHPILIYKDNKGCVEYVMAKDLDDGMKCVHLIKQMNKKGDIFCSWDEFVEKCNEKSKLYGLTNEVKDLRGKLNLSKHKFSEKSEISYIQAWKYEENRRVPFYIFNKLWLKNPDYITSTNPKLLIKNPFPLRYSSSLIRIISHLVGDGSIYKKGIAKENVYDFRYHNTDIDLINQFADDVESVFGIRLTVKQGKPKLVKNKTKYCKEKYYVQVPAVVGRILAILFPEIVNKNAPKFPNEFYPEYIGALFDDEGCVVENECKVFISNTNFDLLDDVKEMLLEVDSIESRLDKKQFKLYIKGRKNIQKFLNKIPFISVDKKQKLIDALSNKYTGSDEKNSIVWKEKFIIAALGHNKMGLTSKEIMDITNLPNSIVRDYLRVLINEGIVEKITVGISEYPRKKIIYKCKLNPNDLFNKYIGEKVINKEFITKTISDIEIINYDGYVYDIINSKYSNFIANDIVVHNSTRADIVEKLVKRGYLIEDGSLTVTDLGIGVIEVLKKYCPEIIDEQMTRELEKKLDRLQKRTIKKETVLKDAEKKLTAILNEVKKKEKEIGAELVEKVDTTNKTLQTIGKCECGGDLGIIRIKNKKRFIGCSNYPECTIIYPLPVKGRIKIPNEVCEVCGKPMLIIDNQKRCINPDCPSKISAEDKKELEKAEKNEKPCPKCGGTLVVKKGFYGAFLGCSNYPKCKHTEKLSSNGEDAEITVVGECPDCGGDLIIKKGRFGEFIGCSNYPKCKHTEKIKKDGSSKATEKTETKSKTTKKKSTTKEKKKPNTSKVVGECPDCGGDLIIKKGRFGEFIGCSNYPKCKHTEKIKKE